MSKKELRRELKSLDKQYDDALWHYSKYSLAKPGDSLYDQIMDELDDDVETRKAMKLLVS